MRLPREHDEARLQEIEQEEDEELQASSVRYVMDSMDSSNSAQEARPQEPLALEQIQPRDKSREEYVNALKLGYNELIDVLLRDMLRACDSLVGSKYASVRRICYDILASTENSVLHALLDGNLAWDAEHDAATGLALDRLRAQAQHQPCIYQRVLVDELNQSPTPAELFDVIEALRRYARTGEWSLAVQVDTYREADSWNENLSKAGRRKYLASSLDGAYAAPSAARLAELELFCQKLHARLDKIPTADWHEPLRFPLVDVAYTVNYDARLAANERHTAARFLMNLVEATCGVLFPGRYRARQFPIYLIFEAQQAVMADLVLGTLAQGLLATGGGTAYWATDCLHGSSMAVDDKNWMRYEKWAVDHSPYVANCRADSPRQSAELDRIKRIMEAKKREMFELKKEYNEGQLQMRLAARDITRRVARCNRYNF